MAKDFIPLMKRKTPLMDRLRGATGRSYDDQPPTPPTTPDTTEMSEEKEDEDIIKLASRTLGKGNLVRFMISYKKDTYEGRVLTAIEKGGWEISTTFKPHVDLLIGKLGRQMGIK